MLLNDIRGKVLKSAVLSHHDKLNPGTDGNISIMDRDSKLIAITPSSIPYSLMSVEDIVVINVKGDRVEGNHQPSSEWRLHAGVYREREDINAIVHTHSQYATALAVLNKPIPVILSEMIYHFYGDIKVSDYRNPGTFELADSVLRALADRTACFLGNHGVLTIGQNMSDAYERAVYVECIAKIYSIAIGLAAPIVISKENQNYIRRKIGLKEEW